MGCNGESAVCYFTCCGHLSLKVATIFSFGKEMEEEPDMVKSHGHKWAFLANVRPIFETRHEGLETSFLNF